jgi:lipoic acid synthetase
MKQPEFVNGRRRLPPWFKVKINTGPRYRHLKETLNQLDLHTVCEEAQCPNQWECWNQGTATFMILGDICTRSCGFCSVQSGRPTELDLEEPYRVADAVGRLGLRHVVVTSVNRDELDDGGASVFAKTIEQIRVASPSSTIEVLIPDFRGVWEALGVVLNAQPDILNHNMETVPRLYSLVRPQAKYRRSIELLKRSKDFGVVTKTGLMLGLGEQFDEIQRLMKDLCAIRCDILTLGQYLQPSPAHLPVVRFYHPDDFLRLKKEGLKMGFQHVESGPLVRSSYHAEEQVPLELK